MAAAQFILDSFLKEAEQEVVPGLTVLKLNILDSLDMQMISAAEEKLIRQIHEEYVDVHNVLKLMVCLVRNKQIIKKQAARYDLEDILKNSPRHLNTLAELKNVYYNLGRLSDAEKCKKSIRDILDDKSDVESKVTCLLEQGFAILNDPSIGNENMRSVRIADIYKMLMRDFRRSTKQRQEVLQTSITASKKIIENEQTATQYARVDPEYERKRQSLSKFARAEHISKTPLKTSWQYHIAKALNQYSESLEYLSKKDRVNREDEMRRVTTHILDLFWKTIEETQEVHSLTLYRARSSAFIGHILVKRGTFYENELLPDSSKWKLYLNNPFDLLEKAYRQAVNDRTVLNRFGRACWNKSTRTEDRKEKIHFLNQSEMYLRKSIYVEDNWFAYSTRMFVRYSLATLQNHKTSKLKKFQLAAEDGLDCMRHQCTIQDMIKFSEIYVGMARLTQGIIRRAHQETALEYLQCGIRFGGELDFHFTIQYGACLYHLGEYISALAWIKRAWMLNRSSNTYVYHLLCRYTFALYEQQGKKEEQTAYLLKEFLFVLSNVQQIKRQEVIERLWETNDAKFMTGIFEIIADPVFHLSCAEREISLECLDYRIKLLQEPSKTEMIKCIEKDIKSSGQHIQSSISLPAITKEPNMPVLFETQTHSAEYEFDFCVLYSQKDEGWVKTIMLSQLENRYGEKDCGFKGCIDDRDFIAGKSVLENIKRAIRNSYKTILILTEDFVNSQWCYWETDQSLLQLIESKLDNSVIAVILDNCDIPVKLETITYLDMTEEVSRLYQILRLKCALLQGD